uniref:Small ribosomal subunit protein uS11c n=1 Tax=Sciadopitys verticillata TaxID=28979 RepID=G3XHJ8_SCIVE|nr:ribosomal protein S11 [Sciadopitys verticillata]AMO00764.1 ribosomal protein S11 [Sciadopitys verticillata]BAK86745.1 ribosomal protein S11 [Sciadopitys verticillata]BAW34559.1 ribosomal protein S11 [Sciadopitys verticillata]BCK60728.1 ribosomal protein S11 [Sciadopitys verticillata]
MPKITRRVPLTRSQFVSRQKHKIRKGIIHIRASFHNTIVTITDIRGQVVSWSSAGFCGFKGPKRGSPFAAQTATENAIDMLGLKRAEVKISGPGRGRDTALRGIGTSGVHVNHIRDVTPIPHNGCRPPKKRCL